ncbi:MAG: peptide chain release factor N(5)-glutamine methyltransferase [Muribaculaceae bacterium]
MKENIRKIRERLAGSYTKGEIDAMERIIFERLMGYSPVDMVLRADTTVPDFISEKIDDTIERLLAHEPIQYVLDDAYFYGLHFHVDRHTLIPRPETEQLIDLVAGQNTATDLQVLDVGTGSGCIAIALARTLKFAHVTATDISPDAIAVAERNAHELKTRVCFVVDDILSTRLAATPSYDIIVSNPPYVTEMERAAMERNVLDYEPHAALFVPDDNPLLFYRTITDFALKALRPGGRLYFEINPLFADDMVMLLTNAGLADAHTEPDYTGKRRFAIAQLKTLCP